MALTELDAAVERTRQLHEAAKQRAGDLHTDAVRAHQEAIEAQSLGEVLLAQVANGEAEIDDDAFLAADEQRKRADALAAIAKAKHEAGLRHQHKAEVEMLHARAAVLESDFDSAVTKLIAAADHVDDRLAALQDAVAAFHEQKEAVQKVQRLALDHNSRLTFAHTNNPLFRDMRPDQQPRARVPDHPLFVNVKAELYEKQGAGSVHERRVQVHALAPRMRQVFGRKVDAA